jgi:DNA-binding IclR family transcriptional regulator
MRRHTEVPVSRSPTIRRSPPSPTLAPTVDRALRLLRATPRGASRADLLAAVGAPDRLWEALRDALEETGEVATVGRGPGQRHVHVEHFHRVPVDQVAQRVPVERTAQLDQARATLLDTLRSQGGIDSGAAQELTGLPAEPVRRILLEMVDQGVVGRTGHKRSTRYHWVG